MELRLSCINPLRYRSGPWFNIKMPPYQYREHNYEDKMIVRLSYLNSGVLYTDKTISLYWTGALSILSQWTVHTLSSRVSYGISLSRVSYGVSLSRVRYGVSLSRVSYGVSFVHILGENNYVIKRFDIVFICNKANNFFQENPFQNVSCEMSFCPHLDALKESHCVCVSGKKPGGGGGTRVHHGRVGSAGRCDLKILHPWRRLKKGVKILQWPPQR